MFFPASGPVWVLFEPKGIGGFLASPFSSIQHFLKIQVDMMDTDMNLRMNIKDSYEHETDYGYEDAYAQIEFIEIPILICVYII